MATQVNIHEAKTHLSRLLKQVAAGEEVIIAKANKPIARLVAVEQRSPVKRIPGLYAGLIHMADDWDAPMSEEELALWYDAPIDPPDKP